MSSALQDMMDLKKLPDLIRSLINARCPLTDGNDEIAPKSETDQKLWFTGDNDGEAIVIRFSKQTLCKEQLFNLVAVINQD